MTRVTWVLSLLFVSAVQAVHVTRSIQTPFCARSNMKYLLTSPVAYNIAFEWSKKADLVDWKFDMSAVNGTNINCATYRYKTRIKLPGDFAQYIGSLMRHIVIHKHVCLANDRYVEDVTIDDTSVVSNLHSRSQSRVRNGMLYTDVDISYDLPWYVMFAEDLASKHIMKSFLEKFVTMSSVLCNETA